ncbi:MAG: DivIVA domain-containing protein [Acidimicrobiia bacterium]
MTDTSGSPARDSRLTPETVAGRNFTLSKRGYAEHEVRSFLRLVADELNSALARERELNSRVRDLEEQTRRPVLPPSDDDLIKALGEETARVLGQARESALELRSKAEDHARRVVREAQETARELRATTQQAVEQKTREAEDSARARAKEIVTEARTVRDRVLEDLGERKTALEQQIDELRQGRGRLVETYELVERALSHARRVIEQEPSAPPVVPDTPATPRPRPPPKPRRPPPPPLPHPHQAPRRKETARPASETSASEAEEDATSPDVHALFEKLRSEQGDESPAAPEAAVEPPTESAAPGGAARPASEPSGSEASEGGPASEPSGSEASKDGSEAEQEEDLSPEQEALRARETALADAADELSRRGKRALQDEQNDVLDGLRRQRGKIDLAKVLPSKEEQLTRWAHVLQPSVDQAYSLGAGSVDGSVGATPRALLTELADAAVTPLRDRLSSSLESVEARTPADMEIAVAQRLGARYREWRGQELEEVLTDALAVAYSRGVYDGVPDGTRLRWIPTHEGKCPDCDDNSLEPTVKGGEFPTGQKFPPAHPGCRCLLTRDDS